ncbi:MAG: HlyD family efflux transporter periplasmic adaptor subunit [candidate division Zixibacteria bacterium]|nr:HlyD family efflux transporter periplasmic adaptor subunit [candidate division Zixibacteria bacterium]
MHVIKNLIPKLVFLILFFLTLITISCSLSGDNGDITASGTIEATEIDISSKVSAELLSLRFSEGDRISKGDTIAIIDHCTLDIQLKQATAALQSADAQLQLLLNGARNEDIRQTEETLTQTKANLQVAKSDMQRMVDLFEKQSVTQKQKDDAVARHTVARSQFKSAQQFYNKLISGARPEEINVVRGQVNQARAAEELLKKSISDCYIKSPIDGILTHKPFNTGELITMGAVVASVTNFDKVNLMLYIAETEIGRIKPGNKANIRIDTFPDRDYPGKVVYISPEAEFTPKNIQTREDRVKLVFGVKIKIDNPDGNLKPGLPADAIIITD